jgi:hypothetical protein
MACALRRAYAIRMPKLARANIRLLAFRDRKFSANMDLGDPHWIQSDPPILMNNINAISFWLRRQELGMRKKTPSVCHFALLIR